MQLVKMLTLSFICAALMVCFAGNSIADDNYFKKTDFYIHMDNGRDSGIPDTNETDILTLTLEHVSEWKYGDTFFFLDIDSGDEHNSNANFMYFEIAPRFSLNKIAGMNNFNGFISEAYLAFQYNDSDNAFVNSAFLYGASVDFNFGQPNYGFSNLSIYYRDDTKADDSIQYTFVWGQPFSIGSVNMAFNGFIDIWKKNYKDDYGGFGTKDDAMVVIAEPQIHLKLASFVQNGGFLSNSSIGMEFEFTKNFLSEDTGWITNPTIFYAFTF